MIRTGPLILLALAAALLAVGCGGSERVEHERDLAKVGRVVDESLAALPQDESSTLGPEEVLALAEDLEEAADQLDDLDPPADAEKAQDRLERGLRGVSSAFEELAHDLQSADTDEQKGEVFVRFATDQQVDAAFDDVIGAQEAYSAKGYRVFGIPKRVEDER